jgi:peptidoglycan/xylan/chitin deacetylase (PgdA/CDA1 family)
VLYLTFDDGPSVQYTPQVLALLQRYHAHAVFCEIGLQVDEHPEISRQVVAAGHTLCDHTLTHDEHLPRRSPGCVHREIDGGLAALRAAVPGVHVPYFRAPGGNWSAEVHAVAQQDGMASLTWTIDPRDWSRPGVEQIIATVTAEARDRSVLLLHDGGGPRDQTVAALTVLLPRLVAQGYHFPVAPRSLFTPHRPGGGRPATAPSASPRCTTAACCAAD